ncbi:MAG: hypothetical protein E7672_08275 [Ruminococcaceae bacterium]|nr:hypothetical protein [Oscillospiraceae bacterium]
MSKNSALRYSEWSLKSKLFAYMLLLTIILLAILTLGLIMFGHTNTTAETFYDVLDIQMEVFEKDISVHFDHLAASAISLSEDLTETLDKQLEELNIPFSALTDSPSGLVHIQNAMLEPLQHKLRQANCSGAFVMLNATVNSSLPEASSSKSGLYLQINGYHTSGSEVLMYRGFAETAKSHEITLHRKWRLEFRTDLFPNYAKIASSDALSLESAYRVTDLFILPGTSEKALLLTVPMISGDGAFYGICGYEISESYFMTYHAQPSKTPHLTCLLTSDHENVLLTDESLSCGSSDGHFHSLTSDYAILKNNRALTHFKSENFSYLGITKKISLSGDKQEHQLVVMIPKSDYDRTLLRSIGQSAILIVLLLFFTVSFCKYFSKRFLSPILSVLEKIKSDKRSETTSNIPEILDLIEYLDRQEREHDKTLSDLETKHQAAENENLRLQTEIDRLAYSRKTEIDPADYQYFIAGIKTLTESEKNLFEYYLSGKTAKEILVLMGIKESTLKYHNHNLLGKLGVSSRKQMLRYAEVMRNQNETKVD